MLDYSLAYGSKENIVKAIELDIIPPGSMILTEDSSEFIFYSLDQQLKIYHEKYKFTNKEEAEEWTSKYDCAGQLLSIHEDGKCQIYVVDYDNQLRPVTKYMLTAPTSAKVGQVLRVAEVDENGNVLAIEAVENIQPTVQSVNGKTGEVQLNASDVGALPADTQIPSKTSDISNDSGFITKTVSDLVNYYSKSQTLSADEINQKISAIPKFSISVVASLPTSDISSTTVYLVKSGSSGDLYTEYIYVDSAWEILGSQKVDLTGYATESWVNIQLADYVKTSELQAVITSALAQAKESGEFKGDPGVHVGNQETMPANTRVRVNPRGKRTRIPQIDDTLSKEGYAADAAAVGKAVGHLPETVANKADVIVDTATGEVLAVSDSVEAPLRGLTVYGKSMQDGTPTPDAPVPIVSVGEDGTTDVSVYGANLIDPNKYNFYTPFKGLTVKRVDNGGLTFSGTFDGIAVTDLVLKNQNIEIPSGKYQLTGCPQGGNVYSYRLFANITRADGSPTYASDMGSGVTFTLNDGDKVIIAVRIGQEWVAGDSKTFYPMLTLCDDVGEFEPYTKQSLPISTPEGLHGIPVTSGGNYTDASGQQWICDEIDFVRGVKVQRIGRVVLDGSEDVYLYTTGGNGVRLHAEITETYTRARGVCTHAILDTGSIKSGVIWFGVSNSYIYWINILDILGLTDTSEFAAWLTEQYNAGSPVTIYHELNSSVETPLTEEDLASYKTLCTNRPNTTIYTDDNAGLSVQYKADTKSYIDKKFNDMSTGLDTIIALQNGYISGGGVV